MGDAHAPSLNRSPLAAVLGSAERMVSAVAPSLWFAGLGLVFLVVALRFATFETIWWDETTQLSGLTLGFGDQLRWLSGDMPNPFLVPPDRQPPASYIFGRLWTLIVGDGVMGLRVMGILLMLASGWLVYSAAKRSVGASWALLGAAFFLLSPNIIIFSAGIRPYPFLIFFSAAAFYSMIAYATSTTKDRAWWLFCVGISIVLAVYSHFFGVFLGGGILLALGIRALALRERLPQIAALYGGVALGSAGILPLVTASTTVSLGGPGSDGFSLAEWAVLVVRMVYRQISSPVLSVDAAALAVFLLSFLALMAFVFLSVIRGAAQERDRGVHGLRRILARPATLTIIAVVSGLGVTAIAGFLVADYFDPFNPQYSFWTIPGIAILVAHAGGATAGLPHSARTIAVIGLLLSLAWGTSILVRHPTTFNHGPAAMIQEVIRDTAEPFTLVYDQDEQSPDGRGLIGFGYFPLAYEHGRALDQRTVVVKGNGFETLAVGFTSDSLPDHRPVSEGPESTIIVLRLAQYGQGELRQHLRTGPLTVTAGPFSSALDQDPAWHKVGTRFHTSFVSARADIYTRRAQD